MKYENYRLPGGKSLSEGTFEDIRWQYGVFRCNSTGAGRDKKYTPWRAVKTKLGEIEECDCQHRFCSHGVLPRSRRSHPRTN